MSIKIPNHYTPYKLYSSEDACIEICNSSYYTYEDAVNFVRYLGYTVIDGGYVMFDEMISDYRGFVRVLVIEENL